MAFSQQYFCCFKLAQLGIPCQSFQERSKCMYEVYSALSYVLHENDVDGIQLYPAKWPRSIRLSLNNEEAKNKLLVEGLSILGKHIDLQDEYGSPLIRVIVSDAPFAMSNDDIKESLELFGNILQIDHEMLTINGKTTACKTGNRIALFTSIKSEIPPVVTAFHEDSPIHVNVWYKERAMNRRYKRCVRCGSQEHDIQSCPLDQRVCYSCREPGHRSFECPKKTTKNSKTRIYQKEDDKAVYFMGEGSTFSNFCTKYPIEVEGKHYLCNEQYIVREKAMLFKDTEVAAEVMALDEPREMYNLGKRIRSFNQAKWKTERDSIIRRCNEIKYGTHEEARNELLATGDKLIAEATADLYWGIGMPIMHPELMSKEWEGENAMGRILQEVRDYFRTKKVDEMIENASPTIDNEQKWAIIIGDSNCKELQVENVPFKVKKLSKGGLRSKEVEGQLTQVQDTNAEVEVVVLHCGTCDFSSQNVDVTNVYAEYVESLSTVVQAYPNTEVLISSIPPRALRALKPENDNINKKIAELNTLLKELTMKESNLSFIDNDDGLKSQNGEPIDMLFSSSDGNGVHFSERGLLILADKMRQGLTEAYYKIRLEVEHDIVPNPPVNE